MSDIKFYGPVHTLSGKKYKDDNITFLTQERTRRVYTRMSFPGQRAGHTPAQQAARTAFTNLRHEAQTILADPQQRKTYFSRWKRQHRFHTLLGFIMHSLSSRFPVSAKFGGFPSPIHIREIGYRALFARRFCTYMFCFYPPSRPVHFTRRPDAPSEC